jgi:hypothetical protein
MFRRFAAWLGTSVVAALGVYLAWEQVADRLPHWSLYAALAVVGIGSVLGLPLGVKDDGSTVRVIDGRSRGRGNASLVSGDSEMSGNIQITGGTVTVNHGLSTEQMDGLERRLDSRVAGEVERYVDKRMEAFAKDVVKYSGEGNQQALMLGRQLITDFVEQLAERAPQNIKSLGTVDMQHAILNAQTSAAVAGDDSLTETLVDILVDKSGAEPRSFKGVVLTEALQVAGKLTADQVNLLTALVMLRLTLTHGLTTPEAVLQKLDSRCQPLYRQIPESNSALQYMAYTGVGDIERTTNILMGRQSIFDRIPTSYDGVFTNGFTVDDLPDELKPGAAELTHVDERLGDPTRLRFNVASSQSFAFFADNDALNEPYLSHREAVTALITNNRCPPAKFIELISADYTELSIFLTTLDNIGASTFELSSVGIAVGQANWRRLLPEDAPDVDMYLR